MITLINSYVAVDDIEQFSGDGGVMQGTVKIIDADITSIQVGDKIFYHKGDGSEVKYEGKQHVVVLQSQIIGKL